ncbi:hypothetical protein MTR67_034920 [Solanum verrucosum]|uniref:Ubiquitin-like domain-containing protein n=1 Tax=Solanum verrucosum TaxID=315347 RepID=A0AAF0U997_SOLVR|nr:hypothetical protein MTR67_034920 [Solanum verrucosum]
MPTAAGDDGDLKEEVIEWEMRPGGMLVQRRSDNSDIPIAQNLRIRVAYDAARYDISINPHATFGKIRGESRIFRIWVHQEKCINRCLYSLVGAGELKKVLREEIGLEAGEQRIIWRGKQRENGEYLDMCGVKDRSKVMLIEDPESKEKRFIQMRKNAKIQATYHFINDVSIHIDKLAQQVPS